MAQEKNTRFPDFLLKAELLTQGAEARLYRAEFLGRPTIVKERFPKCYRHPILDEKLTHRRTVQEVRSILRCRRAGKFHLVVGLNFYMPGIFSSLIFMHVVKHNWLQHAEDTLD